MLSLFLIAWMSISCSGGRERELSPKGREETVAEKSKTVPKKTGRAEDWLTYRIPQGAHDATQRTFRFFGGDTLAFRFSFDSTVVYSTTDPINQADWNKLFGFSDCSSFHQSNSFRFVWRYSEEEGLEIGEYRYADGERHFSSIGTTSVGDTNFAEVVITEDMYLVNFNDEEFRFPRECSGSFGRYWLYPYFGGDETAPREIRIHVLHLTPESD